MIALTRARQKSFIVPSFRGSKPIERLAELMTQRRDLLVAGSEPKLKIKSRWSVTKRQLLAETHDKCAYCESHTAAVAFGDVEHYRPKSVYWWLAYAYDNYLASCAVCNQQFKSDRFEFDGTALQEPAIDAATTDSQIGVLARSTIPDPLDDVAMQTFTSAHHAEGALILNPYFDDPDRFFIWEVLRGAKEVELMANPQEPRAAAVVDACERIYGLNRGQLKRRRYKQWRNYRFALRVLNNQGVDQETRDEAQEMLDSLLDSSSEYAAMVRYFERQRLA